MARDVVDSEIIESRDALVAWLEAGCKPAGAFRVGTEHEKIPFYRADRSPVPYEGEAGNSRAARGHARAARLGAHRGRRRADRPLRREGRRRDFARAGRPVRAFGRAARRRARDGRGARSPSRRLPAVAEPLGIGFLALGMSPKWTLAETPSMPKSRYAIMARYMPKVGTRGLDMMFRTATVQANLDYRERSRHGRQAARRARAAAGDHRAVRQFAVHRRQAQRALSARSEIWRHTDAARTGMLAFAFEPGMGFERYVDYALDVPLYFVKRGGIYQDVAGASFRDLLAGRLEAAPGERATIADWANHLSTIFPEVRLKRYLEMRGADVGPPERIVALSALMIGLYYDADALARPRP